MKRYSSMIMTISFFLTILIVCAPGPTCANSDILLGITWGDSLLVSFDPYTGTITEVHAQLNPNESFRGLAYDSNHNMLYALSQVDLNLYSIDPITLDIQHIGNLRIPCSGSDIGKLCVLFIKANCTLRRSPRQLNFFDLFPPKNTPSIRWSNPEKYENITPYSYLQVYNNLVHVKGERWKDFHLNS